LENVTVAAINSLGQSIGWSGVIAPHYYTASARCQTDGRLVAINGQELMQVLEKESTAGFVMMQRITELISSRLRIGQTSRE
jgi:CRP-like cAMP-binding protein